MGAARSKQRYPKSSVRTWLNYSRAASEGLMPGHKTKYTDSTDAAIRRVNQWLQIIWSDPGTTNGEKIAIMREIHERMAATILGQGEPAPEPLPERRPQNRSDAKICREFSAQ
jgi:hypothetical protein